MQLSQDPYAKSTRNPDSFMEFTPPRGKWGSDPTQTRNCDPQNAFRTPDPHPPFVIRSPFWDWLVGRCEEHSCAALPRPVAFPTLHQALGAFCQDHTSSAELVEIRVRGTVRLGGPRGHSISVTSGSVIRTFSFFQIKIKRIRGMGPLERRSFSSWLCQQASRGAEVRS